jgi:hypothetical protein
MEGLETAMAEMERGRAAFESATQKVLVALHELQSDVFAANNKMHATQMEMVRAARKRQRRSGAQQGGQVNVRPIEAPDEQAFEDSALDAEEHVETVRRAMARVHVHTIEVRTAVDAAKARAAPLVRTERQAAARETRNEGCSALIDMLARVDLGGSNAEAVFGSLSVVQLYRASGASRAFRRWAGEALSRMPRVVAIGGCLKIAATAAEPADWVATPTVEVLSWATLRWSTASGAAAPPPLPAPRAFHVAVVSPEGRVTVAGGCNFGGADTMLHLGRQAVQWSPGSARWEPLPDLGEMRGGAAAMRLADGRTMVAGGVIDGGTLALVEALAADDSGWSALAPMLTACVYATIGLLRSGHVIVAGGSTGPADSDATAAAELWDPATNTWSALPPMAHARYQAAGCVLPSGRFAVLGGYGTDGKKRTDGEVFDPVRRVWEPLPADMANARSDFGVEAVAGGLVVSGGDSRDDSHAPELYDEESGRWFTLPHTREALRQGSMVLLPC